jgi:hypothetical protein
LAVPSQSECKTIQIEKRGEKMSQSKLYKEAQKAFVYPVEANQIDVKSTDRVCIIDGDGSNGVDNLSLLKLSAWEKRHGVSHVRLIKLKTTNRWQINPNF